MKYEHINQVKDFNSSVVKSVLQNSSLESLLTISFEKLSSEFTFLKNDYQKLINTRICSSQQTTRKEIHKKMAVIGMLLRNIKALRNTPNIHCESRWNYFVEDISVFIFGGLNISKCTDKKTIYVRRDLHIEDREIMMTVLSNHMPWLITSKPSWMEKYLSLKWSYSTYADMLEYNSFSIQKNNLRTKIENLCGDKLNEEEKDLLKRLI